MTHVANAQSINKAREHAYTHEQQMAKMQFDLITLTQTQTQPRTQSGAKSRK